MPETTDQPPWWTWFTDQKMEPQHTSWLVRLWRRAFGVPSASLIRYIKDKPDA